MHMLLLTNANMADTCERSSPKLVMKRQLYASQHNVPAQERKENQNSSLSTAFDR